MFDAWGSDGSKLDSVAEVLGDNSYVDHGVRVGHHGNKQVQENDHIDHGVRSKHEKAPKPSVSLDASKIKRVDPNATETRPKEGLRRFKQTRSKGKSLKFLIG